MTFIQQVKFGAGIIGTGLVMSVILDSTIWLGKTIYPIKTFTLNTYSKTSDGKHELVKKDYMGIDKEEFKKYNVITKACFFIAPAVISIFTLYFSFIARQKLSQYLFQKDLSNFNKKFFKIAYILAPFITFIFVLDIYNQENAIEQKQKNNPRPQGIIIE